MEEAYLQAVKEQERVLVEGEVKKARIRARLGEIERRLAEIRGYITRHTIREHRGRATTGSAGHVA